MTDFLWIDPKVLRMLHDESLAQHGGRSGVRDQGLLESALARPETLAHYNSDVDFAALAASYAYGLIKNHAFVDGNKRAAFLSVGLFLGINGYRLTAPPVDAIQAVIGLAAGEISEESFAQWIRTNIAKR